MDAGKRRSERRRLPSLVTASPITIPSVHHSRSPLYDNPSEADSRAGAVFHVGGGQVVTSTQTIVAFQSDGAAIACNANAPTFVNCSDLYGTPTLTDVIHEDPLFRDAAALDFTLQEGSPCLLGQSPYQGVIGAFGIGCLDPVAASESLEISFWARIKSIYR